MMPYIKIQTVFLRDPDNNFKTLLEGQYSKPEFEWLAQNEWIATEKIDGTNIRVMFDGSKVTCNGKSDNAQIHAHLLQYLYETFTVEIMKAQFGDEPTEVCLYGEGYGAGIQSGGYYQESKRFILFDVLITTRIPDKIVRCPIKTHNVTPNENDKQKTDVAAPVIGATTADSETLSLLNDRTTSKQQGAIHQKEKATTLSKIENGIYDPNSESLSQSTTQCQNDKGTDVPFVAENKDSIAVQGNPKSLLSTIATPQEGLGDSSVRPVIWQSTEQKKILDGLSKQFCTCKTTSIWLERPNVEDVANGLGCPIVPIVWTGTLPEMVVYVKQGYNSLVAEKDHLAEGLVMRPATELFNRRGERVITKLKYADFPR